MLRLPATRRSLGASAGARPPAEAGNCNGVCEVAGEEVFGLIVWARLGLSHQTRLRSIDGMVTPATEQSRRQGVTKDDRVDVVEAGVAFGLRPADGGVDEGVGGDGPWGPSGLFDLWARQSARSRRVTRCSPSWPFTPLIDGWVLSRTCTLVTSKPPSETASCTAVQTLSSAIGEGQHTTAARTQHARELAERLGEQGTVGRHVLAAPGALAALVDDDLGGLVGCFS